MNYNHPVKNKGTITLRVMCAVVFVLFSFAWLYFFQGDVMAVAQHVLSNGLTSYGRLLGAVLITAVLVLLQLAVCALTGLRKRFHALTYLPSMLMLALLSDLSQSFTPEWGIAFRWWIPLVVLIAWGGLVMVARRIQTVEDDRSFHLLSRPMWVNMLIMSLLMMGVAGIGNTNAVFHYRAQAENLLENDNFDGALRVGVKSLETDGSLQMLRMYALARKDSLGECLFNYPMAVGSRGMLPTDGSSEFLIYPADSLYRFLGARPANRMKPMRYVELVLERDTLPDKSASAVADYLLCGYLLDRQLDQFAQEIGNYYEVDEHLPRNYREALILYTHLRSNPVLVYHDAVMDENYENLLELEQAYPDEAERKGKVAKMYGKTYWYYYKYGV